MLIFSGFEHFYNCENQQVSSISSSISTAWWRRSWRGQIWGNESLIKKSTFKCSSKTHKSWQACTHDSGFKIRLELFFRYSLLVIYLDCTFFYILVLLRRTSFWQPSMVYISVIITYVTNNNLSPVGPSVGSFHVLHQHLFKHRQCVLLIYSD